MIGGNIMMIIDEEFSKNLGKRLRELRNKSKLSIEKVVDAFFARNVDINEKTIRRNESGENIPSVDNLLCYADIYETSLDYIVAGKETSDDNSTTWYDNFKRLNRLVYSLAVGFYKHADGRCFLELWDEEAKVYFERINNFGVSKNYMFEVRGEGPMFTIKELDNLIEDFSQYKEQLQPNLERYNKMLLNMGIDTQEFLRKKVQEIKAKRIK